MEYEIVYGELCENNVRGRGGRTCASEGKTGSRQGIEKLLGSTFSAETRPRHPCKSSPRRTLFSHPHPCGMWQQRMQQASGGAKISTKIRENTESTLPMLSVDPISKQLVSLYHRFAHR